MRLHLRTGRCDKTLGAFFIRWGEQLLVEQFFRCRHHFGRLDVQRRCELENDADGWLVLPSFNQGDEVTLHTRLEA